MDSRWWSVAVETPVGLYAANYHHACLQSVLSASAVRTLENAIVNAAWAHPLPLTHENTIT